MTGSTMASIPRVMWADAFLLQRSPSGTPSHNRGWARRPGGGDAPIVERGDKPAAAMEAGHDGPAEPGALVVGLAVEGVTAMEAGHEDPAEAGRNLPTRSRSRCRNGGRARRPGRGTQDLGVLTCCFVGVCERCWWWSSTGALARLSKAL
jgi:hypothetical protein